MLKNPRNTLKTKIFLILFLSLKTLISDAAFAQNTSVVIDNSALDQLETYQPPPMFDEAPLTNPQAQNLIEQDINIANPPIPPKRPKTFFASQEFIEEIRQKSKLKNTHKDASKTITTKRKNNSKAVMDITEDPLGRNVQDIKALDILKNIDPEAAKAQVEQQNNALVKGALLSLPYNAGETILPTERRDILSKDVVMPLKRNPDLHLILESYASTTDQNNKTSARRTSLTRAIEIRDFLVEQGLPISQINIRALGSETDKLPTDRVDFILE